MKLRPYQQKLHDDIYIAWSQGHRNVAAVLPTGGGKTVTFAHIVKEEKGASVVLAHRAELVSQISLALARENVRHRIIGPPSLARLCRSAHLRELNNNYVDPNSKDGVASVQTISCDKKNLDWFNQITLWVHDEQHHLLRDNQFGRAVAKFPNARGLGVTATLCRADGKGLGRHSDGLMDIIVSGPAPCELIKMGFLSKYKIFAPPNDFDRSQIKITANGELSYPELKEATKKSTVLGDIVTHYVKHCFGKSGLTFADSIENATDIAARYRASGVSAEVLTGKTPDTLRENIIFKFKNKEIKQIVSVALIDEGFDCPGVEVVSDGAATESFNRFAQRFGRGLRILEGKEYMIYLDHVGNTLRHGLPDAYREYSLDRRERRSGKKSDAIPIRTCVNAQCMQVYERVYKACPYCKTVPPIAERSSPEYVDGDLLELDPSVLAALRGEIGRIDGDFIAPHGLAWPAQAHARKVWQDRQEAQESLRNAIAWFAGLEASRGIPEGESYRRFWFKFGVDVATAQTLGRKEAEELTANINKELIKFNIDGTVNAEVYFSKE